MENRLFAKVGAVRKKPIFLNDGILIPTSSIIDTISKVTVNPTSTNTNFSGT